MGKQTSGVRAGLMGTLALLAANVHCVHRSLSLLQVADLIEKEAARLGGEIELGRRLDLSPEMVRQFLSVGRLVPEVKTLVRSRKIDSVDVAYRLSLLSPHDQPVAAQSFVSGRISGKELRATVSMRRSHPKMRIAEVLERVRKARTIREYLIKLPPFPGGLSLRELRRVLETNLGKENIRSLAPGRREWLVAVSEQGRKRLEEAAKAQGMSGKDMVQALLRIRR